MNAPRRAAPRRGPNRNEQHRRNRIDNIIGEEQSEYEELVREYIIISEVIANKPNSTQWTKYDYDRHSGADSGAAIARMVQLQDTDYLHADLANEITNRLRRIDAVINSFPKSRTSVPP